MAAKMKTRVQKSTFATAIRKEKQREAAARHREKVKNGTAMKRLMRLGVLTCWAQANPTPARKLARERKDKAALLLLKGL